MHANLTVRRRIYITSYARYLKADRAWLEALSAAAELVPDVVGHGYWRIGAPHSRLRRLYLERDRALQRMMLAHEKLEVSKDRLLRRKRRAEGRQKRLVYDM